MIGVELCEIHILSTHHNTVTFMLALSTNLHLASVHNGDTLLFSHCYTIYDITGLRSAGKASVRCKPGTERDNVSAEKAPF